jgi:peroxiredoxin
MEYPVTHVGPNRPASPRGRVNKTALRVSILLTGSALGLFHYFVKPHASEADVKQIAQNMTSSTDWRGQIAPDFELKTNGNETFRLSDNIGKKLIVLNFFATWCDPCREEVPEIDRYFHEHQSEPFLLVGIDSEETPEKVGQFVKALKVSFPVGIDTGAIQKQYGVTAFPTTVVIGVNGTVQFYEAGALANADVAFDDLLRQNKGMISAGRVISAENYKTLAQKQPAHPTYKAQDSGTDSPKLSARAQQIAAKMGCPCGCDSKVKDCHCDTSKKIEKALATEDFGKQSDDEVIKSLNKRFCLAGGM